MKKLLSIFLLMLITTVNCWSMNQERTPEEQEKLDKNLIRALKKDQIDDVDSIRRLLDQGANPNKSISYKTPLITAINRYLLFHPLDPFSPEEKNHYKIIELLLQYKANPNKKGKIKSYCPYGPSYIYPKVSPLRIAIKKTQLYTTRLLLASNAKIAKNEAWKIIIPALYVDASFIAHFGIQKKETLLMYDICNKIRHITGKNQKNKNIIENIKEELYKEKLYGNISEKIVEIILDIHKKFLLTLKDILKECLTVLIAEGKKHIPLEESSSLCEAIKNDMASIELATNIKNFKTALKKIEELEEKEYETKKEQKERFIFSVKKANNKVIPKIQVKLMYNNNPLLAEMPKIFLCL